jgi:hypothetical protein
MAAIDEAQSSNHASNSALDTAILADLTALRAAIVAITAQLDADAGVTDTDYAANNDPAALTVTAS